MKVYFISFLLLVGVLHKTVEGASQDTCDDFAGCLEDIADAQECIQSCDSLKYDECLDEFMDEKNNSKKKIEELVECCGLDNKCEDTLEKAQDCIGVCIDGCLQDTGTAYTECLGDENKCSKGGCAAALSDVDNPAGGDVEKTVKKLKPEDLQDCKDIGDFYEDVCKAGKDCCKDCNPELANVLDCMINDVVIPYVAVELNTTIGECPVADECKYRRRRDLNEFQVSMGLSQKIDHPQSERRFLSKTVEECNTDFDINLIATNVTDAATKYVDCLLQVTPETEETESGSPAFQLATLVATLLTSMVVSF